MSDIKDLFYALQDEIDALKAGRISVADARALIRARARQVDVLARTGKLIAA
jgi:hypothetical protein